ncbi:MAG: PaaI family thioesterase [Solirubrobacteraceae bacterium]
MYDAVAPWREPVRGGHPAPSLAARPGIELLRAMLARETPSPPLSRLTGMRPIAFTAGSARFDMPLSGWLCGEDGRVPLGVLAIPADAAMACAIIAGLPAGVAITTTELALRQVRPALPGRTLCTHATVLDLGPPMALAEVTLSDDSGALLARGGSLCVQLPFTADGDGAGGGGGDDHDDTGPADELTETGPDPWERPAPEAGLGRLTGLRRVALAEGAATFALPVTRWLCAPPPGRAQGGAVAMLAGAAIEAAMQTAAPDDARFVPLELKVNYLRPLVSDGREARAQATLVHGGRRTAVARAEVSDADGRAIAVASGSALAGAAG